MEQHWLQHDECGTDRSCSPIELEVVQAGTIIAIDPPDDRKSP